jgi:uroporphyrin-3 C-methyltransferase
VLLTALATAALVLAWNGQQRVKALEGELVKRQQDSGAQAAEARPGPQAQDLARVRPRPRWPCSKRVWPRPALQRTQLEDLIQSMARSRDENVLADVDAAIRVADAADRHHRQCRAAGRHAEAGRRAPGPL